MDSYMNQIECVATALDMIFALVFMTIVLGKSKKLPVPVYVFLAAIFVAADTALQFMFSDSSENIVIYITCMTVFTVFCIKGKSAQKLLYVAVWNIVLMVGSLGYASTYSFFKKNTTDDIWDMTSIERIQYLIGQKLLLLLLMICTIGLLKSFKLKSAMTVMNMVVFAISVLIGIILDTMLDYQYLDQKGKAAIGIAMAGLLAINVFVYIASYQLTKNQKLVLENHLLRMSQEEQKESMTRLMQLQEKNRILRHDLRHYFTVFQELLATDKIQEAKQYVEDVISTKLQAEGVYMTGDDILDAVLNHCDSLCRQKNIPFFVEVSALLPKGQMEFAIVLLNLLENAIEAEEKEEEKRIELSIYESAGLLLVTVRNRISHSVLKENPELTTHKSDSTLHGLGRKSVKKLIQDMEGSFYEEEKNGYFISNIVV